MHIGILQAGHLPPELRRRHGDYDAMFATLLAGRGLRFTTWDVEHMTFPASPRDADGWLITGSRHGVYEDHPFIPPLEAFVRDAYAANRPLVGICFGHQIVAQALGGHVEKFDGGWGLGRHDYDLGPGRRITLNAWHQDQVVARPPQARPIARSPFCENAMLVYADANGAEAGPDRAFTIQAHPEFDDAVISDFVATRRGTGDYPDDRMDVAATAAADGSIEAERARMAGAIVSFFTDRRAHVPG